VRETSGVLSGVTWVHTHVSLCVASVHVTLTLNPHAPRERALLAITICNCSLALQRCMLGWEKIHIHVQGVTAWKKHAGCLGHSCAAAGHLEGHACPRRVPCRRRAPLCGAEPPFAILGYVICGQ
jgi:hypothetical protein